MMKVMLEMEINRHFLIFWTKIGAERAQLVAVGSQTKAEKLALNLLFELNMHMIFSVKIAAF